MRGWVSVAMGLAIVTAASAAPPLPPILDGNGFAAGSRTATFGRTSRAEAIALAAAALGPPAKQGSHGDCGQGDVIGYARFRGGFELSFVRGRLSGWAADGSTLRTRRGITVGATLARLRQAYPDIDVDPGDEAHGGLGPSFAREGGPNGWLDGTRATANVTGLYAGATCIAGV